MVFLSFHTKITYGIDQLSHCITSTAQAITTSRIHSKCKKANNNLRSHPSKFPRQPFTLPSFSPMRKDLLLRAPLGSKSSEPGEEEEEDPRALETVLKLYSAIKNNNITKLADVIGDECHCLCNFFSSLKPFQGKKQVLDFFKHLIASLGNNINFVVTPTMQDGMRVGIEWRLEWKNTSAPLGKGFSIYTSHVYHGKFLIRNVEMFMEPYLHVEHLRMVTLGSARTLIDKMRTNLAFRDKPKSVLRVFLRIFITSVLLFLIKYALLH